MVENTDILSVKQRFGIIGNSEALNRALGVALRVAPTDLSVLVTGESGVGKEFFPQIIHAYSARKHAKYIAVNCGAIPEGTIDSELFGHEKGSFTGATESRKGYFEEADGGTIFLDEVGELPLSTQVRLLRVLQSGEFLRVGSARAQKTNVRVVAATNNDLLKSIETGRFREDLYYRLNTVPIAVPALRERPEDIPLLFRKFAADIAVQYHMPAVTLDEGARQLLQNYYWRGNVRQLKNVAEQISALERNRTVTADILAGYLSPNQSSAHTMTVSGAAAGGDFSTERELLYKILFDMRSDINDLKRMLGEMMHGTTHTPAQPTQPEVIGLLPSSVVARPAEEDYAESEEAGDEPRREQSKAVHVGTYALPTHKGAGYHRRKHLTRRLLGGTRSPLRQRSETRQNNISHIGGRRAAVRGSVERLHILPRRVFALGSEYPRGGEDIQRRLLSQQRADGVAVAQLHVSRSVERQVFAPNQTATRRGERRLRLRRRDRGIHLDHGIGVERRLCHIEPTDDHGEGEVHQFGGSRKLVQPRIHGIHRLRLDAAAHRRADRTRRRDRIANRDRHISGGGI